MISNFKGWEWIFILILALVLFGGAKKLPDAARGLGRSLRIFKAETKGLVNDEAGTSAPAAADEASSAPATDEVVLTSPTKPTATAAVQSPGPDAGQH